MCSKVNLVKIVVVYPRQHPQIHSYKINSLVLFKVKAMNPTDCPIACLLEKCASMSVEKLLALLTNSAGIKSQPNWTLVELFEYPHKSPDVKAHDPFSCGFGVLPPEKNA